MAEVVKTVVADQVASIVLNRPERHNAFDDDVMQQLTRSFREVGASSDIRVVVLAGQGKSFCAGADVGWMKRMVDYSMEDNEADAMFMSQMLQTIRRCPKPVIARIHGATFGGGVGLVSACDLAVALRDVNFSLSEVRLGIVPAVISPFVLAKIGPAALSHYALTAERFDAAQAHRVGLISAVVDTAEELDRWVADAASKLKRNGPQALAACKQILSQVIGMDWDRIQKMTSRRTAEIRVSAEGQEGLRSFLEKREPNWLQSGH